MIFLFLSKFNKATKSSLDPFSRQEKMKGCVAVLLKFNQEKGEQGSELRKIC